LRLLVVALCVFAWTLPVAQRLDVGATSRDAHHDVEFVAHTAQLASFGVTKSRAGDAPEAGCALACVASSPTVSASARTVLSAPPVPRRATRWILRHATTSAIP
jgi:hypothetical protein